MNRLVTIPISHYCEKARWALERAGVEYRHDAHLQGFHYLASFRAGRSRSVPVLVTASGEVLTESRAIVEFADRHLPASRRLFTGDPEVSRLADLFDARLGPHARRWMYSHTLDQPMLVWRYGRADIPRWQSALLPPGFPLIRELIKRGLDISPESAARSLDIVRVILDDVAAILGDGRRYLSGDRFTAADLGFACLMAPMTLPSEYGVRLPRPDELPAAAGPVLAEVAAHPAGEFALRLFREDRR